MLRGKNRNALPGNEEQTLMLNILICDDEPAVAAELEQRLRALPDFCEQAMQLCCLTQPQEMLAADLAAYDLLFLDIDMGDVNGIDLARKLRRTRPDSVLIFVTNFIEYAPEGYEVDAFRYLSKQQLDLRLPVYFADALVVCRTRKHVIDIPCVGGSLSIPIHLIIYIESIDHEQRMHLNRKEKNILYTRMTITELAEQLSSHGFLLIHRSFLVNMAYLQKLQSTGAVLEGGIFLPVSTRTYRQIKQKYLDWVVQQE